MGNDYMQLHENTLRQYKIENIIIKFYILQHHNKIYKAKFIEIINMNDYVYKVMP